MSEYVEPIDPLVAHLVARLDDGLREDFEERAGIIEYDGGVERNNAEHEALLDLLERFPDALAGVTVLQVELDGGANEILVTTDADFARTYLAGINAKEIATLALADVIRAQFGGIAALRIASKGAP